MYLSLVRSVIPRRNWKQWVCKIWGVGNQGALYSLCENGEYACQKNLRFLELKFIKNKLMIGLTLISCAQ